MCFVLKTGCVSFQKQDVFRFKNRMCFIFKTGCVSFLKQDVFRFKNRICQNEGEVRYVSATRLVV